MTLIMTFKDNSIIKISGFTNEWNQFVLRRVMESNPQIKSIDWQFEYSGAMLREENKNETEA